MPGQGTKILQTTLYGETWKYINRDYASEEQKEKGGKKNEQSLKEKCYKIKQTNSSIIEIPEGEERNNGT